MFWYRQYIFIASSLRRISFIVKPFGGEGKTLLVQALGLAIIICAASCREPFDPKVRPQQTNFLVVEGIINANGFTSIRLGRTLPLHDSSAIKAELKAKLIIQGEDNSSYNLRENESGFYVSDSLTLNPGVKYRLDILTADAKEYSSAFVTIKKTPP